MKQLKQNMSQNPPPLKIGGQLVAIIHFLFNYFSCTDMNMVIKYQNMPNHFVKTFSVCLDQSKNIYNQEYLSTAGKTISCDSLPLEELGDIKDIDGVLIESIALLYSDGPHT